MELNDRGRLRVAVVLAVAVAAVGIISATGFVFASDDTTGEDVFEDVQEKYNTADSVSADAVVTVETANGTTSFESAVAATADGETWLNLSGEEGYVTMGSNEDSVWVHEPETGVSAVLVGDDETATVTLQAGTADPRAGITAFDAFDANQTVGDVLGQVNESALPAEWQDALDEVPENATLGELADGEYDDVLDNETTDVDVSALRDQSQDAVGGEAVDSILDSFDGSMVVSDLEDAWSWNESHNGLSESIEGWNESEWSGDVDELRDRLQTLADELNETEANRSIELAGTTTVDGQEAHELVISNTAADYETRLWTGVDSNEILKVEWTGPETTVTVDVTETRFDVSPADSTFEAPGTTELAQVDVTATEDADEFGTAVPFTVASPGEGWEFERGYTATTEVSVETNTTVGDVLVAVYSDGEESIVVTQSDTAREFDETVTVGDREVRIEEYDGTTVGAWTANDTTTAILGPFSESELREVIESVSDDA
ncbi:hypothetical protein [Halovenus salina]|uniref:Outer membrane lipoprotein-sorting protein n=1 Tax=Halovenus salina TaxID=1510225 RepID=A0ABD5W5I5_9EURY|nr:hypothetical protein [Halovenus salina]